MENSGESLQTGREHPIISKKNESNENQMKKKDAPTMQRTALQTQLGLKNIFF
jgi:hypothetical protein